MNIEQLSKAQIVLLTLLVSFVTSIATGIVTVTLVSQAPPAVTQTINRVVERTIERVVSSSKDGQTAGSATKVITKEVQVVVKEGDLITDAVSKVRKSLVRVYTLNRQNTDSSDMKGSFVSLGLIISRGGLIVTDSSQVISGLSYIVETADGATFTARIKNKSLKRSTAILEINKEENKDVVFPPVAFSDLSTLKLGESTLTLSGKSRTTVDTGIVSDLVLEDSKDGENNESVISRIKTNINDRGVLFGAPLIDFSGEVVGFYTKNSGEGIQAIYIPNTIVKDQLEEVLATSNVSSE